MSGTAHYFDDFAVGDTFETRGRTVTETHHVTHAGNTGDVNELQMNETFARDSRFGQRVVHVPLTYSMMEGLLTSDWRHEDSNVSYYRLESMRILEPTFVGDTSTVCREVLDKREKPPGDVVTFRDRVTTETGRTVLVCETLEYLRSREP